MNIRGFGTAIFLALATGAGIAEEAALEKDLRFKIDRSEYLRQFETVFQKPIRHGRNAVPVGNGDLAVVAWQPDHLTWMLNKCDIHGNASQAARLSIVTPEPISDRVGTLETRLSLAEAAATVTYEGGKLPQSAGWMWRGKAGAAPPVTDKDKGSVRAHFYVPEERNVFLLSYAEESDVVHPVTVAFERWVQKEFGGEVTARVHENTAAIVYNIGKPDHVESYAAVLAFDGFDGATFTQPSPLRVELTTPKGTKVSGRIAVAVVTSLEAENPLEAATKLARDTLRQPEEKLWAAHTAWWEAFWNRVFVDAGHPYANALYHMSLYELGITSRGARPVQFNGALNLWSEAGRTWGNGYWCHNQSESYLQVYAANQTGLADNFHDWIARIRPEAVKAARKWFQAEGAYYPEVMKYAYQVTEPEKPATPSGMSYILSSGTRYALMMWNRYSYRLDKAFLREKAWPVIRDCAEFYVAYGKLGDDGLYHVAPSLAWEEHPVGRDSHSDCAAWRAIFDIAIKAAKELDVDADRIPVWQERLDKAPPYPMADDLFSVVLREDGTPEPTDHFQWQLPNLSGVFPYSVIGIDSPSDLRKTAEDTFLRYRFNADAGHEFLPVVAARLGNPEWWRAALFQYVQFFQVHDQGLFHYYNIFGSKDVCGDGENDGMHPYLEASGIYATAINEALLQSHDGKIRVFPAIPERWPARFILRAEGSFMVASEHRGREGIPYIAIEPVGGEPRDCSVVIPWDEGADLIEDGKQRRLGDKDATVTFPVRPGGVYVLVSTGAKLEETPMLEVGFDRQVSPARVGNVWYGSRDGANNHSGEFPLW